MVTLKNSNTNEIDKQIDIVDIIDEQIDIANNAIDINVFKRLKTNIVDVLKENNKVLQAAITTTTIATNTKIIFLN